MIQLFWHTYFLASSHSLLGNCEDLDLPNCDNGEVGTLVLTDILGIVFTVTGALAVIFIFIGGFRYVLSGGNPQNTKTAWETILYAIVGLMVSIFAFALVSFVARQAS